jgi:aspartate/methionine/tyrosine aminotransferase
MLRSMQIRDFLLERYYGLYEFTTRHQLSASDCEALTVSEVLELAGTPAEALLDQRLGYTETRGDPALRDAIAACYPGCDADDVLVFNAPQEAVFLAMHAVLAPGDRAVVMTPCYQSLKEVARSIGADVVEWDVVETESGWRLDLDALDEMLRPGTRLLVTNAPHNPTGLLPAADEWRRIGELVRERGVRWFSDEMYRGLAPPALELTPGASLVEGGLSLWGLSKSFGLPGLRIGWLACRDRAMLAAIERLKDYTSICTNALGETVAVAALRARDEIIGRNRDLIASNTARMNEFVSRHAGHLAWIPPTAGPVALARLRGGLSATDHAETVRVEGGALLVPATLFDYTDRHLRIGLGRADFPDALGCWGRVLEKT